MRPVYFLRSVVAALLLISGACGKGGGSFSLLADSEQFVQDGSVFNNKIDILFVINDEPSMSAFQAKLVQSFSSFMQLFQSKGFDFKIAVITTAAYMADPTLNGYNPANASLVDFNDYDCSVHSGVYVLDPTDPNLLDNFAINARPCKNSAGQDGRSFSSFRHALQTTRPINSGFLREDSFLAVVIVDNQEDFSGNARCTGCNNSGRYNAPTLDSVSTYVDFLDQITGSSGATARYNVSAMTQSSSPCQGGANMVRVMELATLTNGVIGDICQADFGPSLAQIADHIALLSSQFFLDRKPIVESISVHVNGALVPQDANNGWTYNAEANSIMFHGTAVPQQGAVIDVDYDPTEYGS